MRIWVLLFLCGFFLVGCDREKVSHKYLPTNAHEAYLEALKNSGIEQTALGSEWIKASLNALKNPVSIKLPFNEVLYFDSHEAHSAGYRFFVPRGQRIEAHLSYEVSDSLQLFIQLFREREAPVEEWWSTASASFSEPHLIFEPRRDYYYILRIQPELLRGGRFTIRIRQLPSLGFPVEGKNSDAVQSFFNDPRDGGRRNHHGVDVFAARHTPVLAPTDGFVRRTGNSKIGGNHIWLYDSKRLIHMYFAHLQDIYVKENDHVNKGDTLGSVGNTGNAITTRPHLHFGIYASGVGAIDPLLFIKTLDTIPGVIASPNEFLGKYLRTSDSTNFSYLVQGAGIREMPLEKYSILKVEGVNGAFFRVRIPGQIEGLIKKNKLEPLREIHHIVLQNEVLNIFDSPSSNGIIKTQVLEKDSIQVLGKYRNYLYIKTRSNITGWINSMNSNTAS